MRTWEACELGAAHPYGWGPTRSCLCKKKKNFILPLGTDVGSAMSNNYPTHHKEHRAAPETSPTNPWSLCLPLSAGLQLPLLLQLGVGEMLIPSAPKPLNSWQAREMSEKAILYPHPLHGHSSKREESNKLGPRSLDRLPPHSREGCCHNHHQRFLWFFGRGKWGHISSPGCGES